MSRIISRILLFSLLLVLSSCSTLKYEWGNFTAYYNTFFNARTYYEKGYEAVLKGQPQLVSEKLIRVTEIPSKAGYSEFDKSIEKGAKILREHESTKWIDDALLLIGQAYFYQMNFFSAEEKFAELYTNTLDKKLIQRSVFWRARALYELRQYDRVLELIDQEFSAIDMNWDKSIRAHIELVRVETLIELDDVSTAKNLLSQIVGNITNKQYKAKAWFLLGQLQEFNDETQAALYSYSQVAKHTNEYSLELLAQRKQAEIARNNGELDKALKLFTEMSEDDKNYDIIYDLYYEIGKTHELKGNFKKAESIYKEVLYNKIKTPGKETIAKTHYGLALIHLNNYKNLHVAAAYFDTAASRSNGIETLPDWFDASEKALHYKNYARLDSKRDRFDSLLYLSTLNKVQLDSVIAHIKELKQAELDALKKKQEQQQSTMINTSAGANNNANSQEQTSSAENGFLNYKNPILVQQAKEQFMAVWGNRPLADKWRYAEALKNITQSDTTLNSSTNNNTAVSDNQTLLALKIDLKEIPFEAGKKKEMREQLAETLYELGNVFYLNLNQIDSARYYYELILEEFSDTKIINQTRYTLSELYTEIERSQEARSLAEEVHNTQPTSVLAENLRKKYNFALPDSLKTQKSSIQLVELVQQADALEGTEKAESLKQIALNQDDKVIGSELLNRAAEVYMKEARSRTDFDIKFATYTQLNLEWDSLLVKFQAKKDSVKTLLTDSLKLQDSVQYISLKMIADSTLKKPDLSAYFPFIGSYWDSTRSVFKVMKEKFGKSANSRKYEALIKDIQLPEALIKKDTVKNDSTQTLPPH